MSVIVRIQHPVRDYGRWKVAFDSDPIGRVRMGVRRYRVARSADDPLAVSIDLELDDLAGSQRLVEALERMWQMPQAQAAMAGAPTIAILELTEMVEIDATEPVFGP